MSRYNIRKSFPKSLLRRTTLGAVVLFVVSTTSMPQNADWQEMRTHKLFTFDLDCAEKSSFPKKALEEIVRHEISTRDGRRDQTYGDMAVAVKLDEHGPTVFFIPTLSGSEDCHWLIYSINPLKSLGEINGNSIITYHSARGMPRIVATGVVDTFTTSLSTYSYDSQTAKYKWLGDKHLYVVDKQVKAARPEGEIPEFFRKPQVLMPQCKNMIR